MELKNSKKEEFCIEQNRQSTDSKLTVRIRDVAKRKKETCL